MSRRRQCNLKVIERFGDDRMAAEQALQAWTALLAGALERRLAEGGGCSLMTAADRQPADAPTRAQAPTPQIQKT